MSYSITGTSSSYSQMSYFTNGNSSSDTVKCHTQEGHTYHRRNWNPWLRFKSLTSLFLIHFALTPLSTPRIHRFTQHRMNNLTVCFGNQSGWRKTLNSNQFLTARKWPVAKALGKKLQLVSPSQSFSKVFFSSQARSSYLFIFLFSFIFTL